MRPQCRNACATAAASGEVRDVCRRSDEQVLYDCFEHQEAADSCCGKAVTSECLQVSKENVMGKFPVYAYRALIGRAWHKAEAVSQSVSDIRFCEYSV